MSRIRALVLGTAVLLGPAAAIALCPPPTNGDPPGPGSPLVLDLDGGGIFTTSIFYPVEFDFDVDGLPEEVTWINPETGDVFLVLDLNGNGLIDNGRELFGNSTLLPDGSEAANGFEALAVYDVPAFGGDGDGMISRTDRVWNRLRLWSDYNYDAFSDPWELWSLEKSGVEAIGLEFAELNQRDGNLNLHWLKGAYIKAIRRPDFRPGPPILRTYDVVDVLFYSVASSTPPPVPTGPAARAYSSP